jgi:hypothetical protein
MSQSRTLTISAVMDLKKTSLAEFLCDDDTTMAEADDDVFETVKPTLVIGPLLQILGEGYALHQLDDQSGDVVLLYADEPVGCYWGEQLAISPDHQGKKLSVPLILLAVAERPLPAKRTMSKNGKKALTSAWKVANGKATNPWLCTSSREGTEPDGKRSL